MRYTVRLCLEGGKDNLHRTCASLLCVHMCVVCSSRGYVIQAGIELGIVLQPQVPEFWESRCIIPSAYSDYSVCVVCTCALSYAWSCVCMLLCVHCVCLCMHAHMCMFACLCVYAYACLVCVHVQVCIHMPVCVHAHLFIFAYSCVCVLTCVGMHVHTQVCAVSGHCQVPFPSTLPFGMRVSLTSEPTSSPGLTGQQIL